MRWEPMTIEEFAGYRRAEGMKLVKVDDIWWAEVRPFFYRPLFPFCEIPPRAKRYPWKSLLGGYLHLVPAAVQATSCICFHVYDEIQNYSLDVLSSKRRKRVRDSLSKFVARPLEDRDEFVENGYEVYKTFYQRTRYWYKSDRIKKDNFRAWAHNLYDHPKINKTGIYQNGTLCGVETSYRLEDIIFGDNLFTDDVSLQSNVVDFLMHRLRESASRTDARLFFSGLPTGVTTLDNSNSKKGCKMLRLPAHCKINPLALTFARLFMKESYRKLLTVLAQDDSGCVAGQDDRVI